MLITKKVKIKWHTTTKKHYEEKGYVFTKYRDEFEIKIDDIKQSSVQLVEFICDYCNGENQIEDKHKRRQYYVYIQLRKDEKDCCSKCRGKKTSETVLSKPIPKDESLASKFPSLISEWSAKNEKSPQEFNPMTHQIMWWICKKGHEWEAKVSNRTKLGRGCPYCSGQKVYIDNCLATISPHLIKEWHYNKNAKLTPYDVTNKTNKKVWWICSKCDHEWETSVSTRTSNSKSGCPQCNESKGERKIREHLKKNKIKFITQYVFRGLFGVQGNHLKFDFAILDTDKKLIKLIEFDGEFHFRDIYKDGTYENQVLHDQRKNKYCAENDICLLRIPYWHFEKIEDILDKEVIMS